MSGCIINSFYHLLEERVDQNSYKNGDTVTTVTYELVQHVNTVRPGYKVRVFVPKTLQVD